MQLAYPLTPCVATPYSGGVCTGCDYTAMQLQPPRNSVRQKTRVTPGWLWILELVHNTISCAISYTRFSLSLSLGAWAGRGRKGSCTQQRIFFAPEVWTDEQKWSRLKWNFNCWNHRSFIIKKLKNNSFSSFIFSLSLSLSLSHTHTHARTHARTHTCTEKRKKGKKKGFKFDRKFKAL